MRHRDCGVVSDRPKKQLRRTQAERLAKTRKSLLDAAITVLNRDGYNGATTAVIAEEAGVSRGSIIYHFETRAQLMTEVLFFVYDYEQQKYAELERLGFSRSVPSHWPDMLWDVIGTPSGMAVIEILLATRSDPQLAELVKPAVKKLEITATKNLLKLFPGVDSRQAEGASRLFLWAIRGLVIAQKLASQPGDIENSLAVFRLLVERAFEAYPLPSPPKPDDT